VADVLVHAETCRTRIADLEHADRSLENTDAELRHACAELERLAGELSARRREAAPAVAGAVAARLKQLALADARFDVQVQPRPGGIGPGGADEI
jgi:DNA repair protein RecN (Recombination protein N)